MLQRAFQKQGDVSRCIDRGIPKLPATSKIGEDWRDLRSVCMDMMAVDPRRRPKSSKCVEKIYKLVEFIPAERFVDAKEGFAFRMGEMGLGFYKDAAPKGFGQSVADLFRSKTSLFGSSTTNVNHETKITDIRQNEPVSSIGHKKLAELSNKQRKQVFEAAKQPAVRYGYDGDGNKMQNRAKQAAKRGDRGAAPLFNQGPAEDVKVPTRLLERFSWHLQDQKDADKPLSSKKVTKQKHTTMLVL